MALGPWIRRRFGRFEKQLADLYRGLFFDLDELATFVADAAPARAVLEIGCGEGALVERLAQRLPASRIVGIDITERAGRLAGNLGPRIEFRRATAGEVAASSPGSFDLVILCDVLHHVPVSERDSVLRHALAALSPEGRLLLKEWERRPSIIYALGYLSDRFLTGDRIRYETANQWLARLRSAVGEHAEIAQRRFRPWKNNLAFLVGPR